MTTRDVSLHPTAARREPFVACAVAPEPPSLEYIAVRYALIRLAMKVTDEESISESSCSTASEQLNSKAKAKQARKNERKRLQRAQETEEQRAERLRKRREAEAAKRATLEGECSRARRNETLRRRRAQETEEQRAERLEKRRRKNVCVSTGGPVQISDCIERVAQFASATREFRRRFTENSFGNVCCVCNRLGHKRDLQTGETCTCSRAPLRCTASTQTTQDECSLPSASEAGTQTLAILRTAATQTPRHHSSGVQTDSCELSLPPATPERSADASASLWGLQAQASSTPVQRKLFGDADQIEEAEVNNLALLDDSYRPSAASQNCTNARTKRSSFGADDKGSYTMNCASLLDLKFFEQVQERFTRLKPEVARAMKATILKILDKAAKS
nr:uncharacterized protein LOC126522712 isoform X2 [Dermacentor andersoni]